jgi:uncharacterized membrane protein YoaK (UPF0700 family)
MAPMATRRLTPTGGRDFLLVALTFSSGAIDALSFIALGKVFTAFMTGNVVFLGLIAAGAPGPDVVTVATALVTFGLGVFVATRLVGAAQPAGVWPARVTGVLGLVVLAQGAFAAGWIAVGGVPSDPMTDLLAGALALAMGLQSGAILSLGVKGVFTTAATATLMYLSRELAAESTPAERARHAGVILALLAGAVSGGLLLEHARTYAALLPLAVTVLVVAIAYDPLGSRDVAPEPDDDGLDFGWRSPARRNGAGTSVRRQRNAAFTQGVLDGPRQALPRSYRRS